MKWHACIGFVLVTCAAHFASAAQGVPPVVQWQKSFGGTNYDCCGIIRQTADGGYLLGGSSESPPSGNKTSAHIDYRDVWLIRLDAQGNKVWEQTYGGTGDDWLLDMIVSANGDVFLGVKSFSGTNSIKTASVYGDWDYWLIKLDSNGNKLWDRSYGGAGEDILISMDLLADGGIVLAGYSDSSPGGNKTSPLIGLWGDFWIVRTDSEGNVIWDRSYGGTTFDQWCWGVRQTADGGFILSGDSYSSPSGTKTAPNLGRYDVWMVRIDAQGNPLWDKSYGGGANDISAQVRLMPGGGFVMVAASGSQPGPYKSSPYYGSSSDWAADYWVLRLDTNGERIWDRSFGGTGQEEPRDIQPTSDGGFIVCGWSTSGLDGNKTSASFGAFDGWVVRLDAAGNIVWQLSLGGSSDDIIQSARQTKDGGFILSGHSASGIEGNKTSPQYGGGDLWVIKLGPDALTAPQLRTVAQSAEQIRTSGFRLELQPPPKAPTDAVYVIEASTNMASWADIQTNRLATGASVIEFVDTGTTNCSARFYRARMEP